MVHAASRRRFLANIPECRAANPAGIRYAQWADNNCCAIHSSANRQAVCGLYLATEEFCGVASNEALCIAAELKSITGTVKSS